jgi:hypothetical protein
MACDTRLKPRQTIQERADEVRRAVEKFAKALTSGSAKIKVGPQGAVVIEGMTEQDRDGVTDACAVRRIMATGSALAKAKIAAAEALAGRSIDRKVIGQGVHSHDGGATWHRH